MGSSTGVFDVGGQRLVAPPLRGRANELKVIRALVTALARGRGGVLIIEGATPSSSKPCSSTAGAGERVTYWSK